MDIVKRSRGLNQEEVNELVEYIRKNNSWYNLYHVHNSGRKAIKYYTFTYDTRTNEVWKVDFYEISGRGVCYKSDDHVIFRTEPNTNLKERIYQWLDEVVEPLS